MCAIYFGLYLGHPKNLTTEEIIKSKGPIFTVAMFVMLKRRIYYVKYNSIRP